MVIYGVTMSTSISDLFIAGIVPALIVGVVLIAINYVYCKKAKLVGTHKPSLKEFLKAVKDGWTALIMPVIILGGIYSGIFTVTECSVVATVYGIIISFVYKEMNFSKLFKEFKSTAVFCGGTLLTLAPSAALGQVFVVSGITDAITGFFAGLDSQVLSLLMVFVILFIAGMFIQTTPMICILGPILNKVMAQTGMTTLEFGVIMVLALSVAFCTPPMALNLFVSSSMTGVPIDKITRPMMPFLIGLIGVMLLLMFCPGICSFILG
jgi:C4-dicarboxylate transporter DctM subunit